jgi:hypothetical protein
VPEGFPLTPAIAASTAGNMRHKVRDRVISGHLPACNRALEAKDAALPVSQGL